MSSRALRKAQREKEEQELLKRLEKEAQELEDGDESEEEQKITAPKQSAFALLGDDGEDDDEDHADDGADLSPADVAPSRPSNKKRKKKKKRAKPEPDNADAKVDDEDEIDAALKSLSMNGSSQPATTAAGRDVQFDEACNLLAIDTQHLHAENEMRQLFGRTAREIEDEDPAQGAQVGGNRRQQRLAQNGGLAQAIRGQRDGRRGGLSSMALRRNIFVQGKEEWPVGTSGGLAMEVSKKFADGTVLYQFVHNAAYQEVQIQFNARVETMDPEQLVHLLSLHPYHISTLLQVSEIALAQHENSASSILVERALFAFGRAVHSTFAAKLAEGKARLDFRLAENREFWLAGWKYLQILKLRGTWRTAYEWGKLLLALSPLEDPYGMWYILDQFAYRSRQDLDYLNLSRNKTWTPLGSAEDRPQYPNIELGQALLESRAGNQSKGKQALFRAVGRYPWIIARLFQDLNIDAPPAIWGEQPRSEREALHCELYAVRAKDLWLSPESSALLQEIACAVPQGTPKAPVDSFPISLDEARHVILADLPPIIALLPNVLTQRMTSSSDPLPPEGEGVTYLAGQAFQRSRRESEGSLESHPVERLRLHEALRQAFEQAVRPQEEGGWPAPSPEMVRGLENMAQELREGGAARPDAGGEENRHARVEDASEEDF